MDEEAYQEIKDYLTEDLGREPTDAEITNEYSAQCDWAYEGYKERLYDN